MTEESGMTEVVRMLMEDHARQDEEDARRERERAAEREQCEKEHELRIRQMKEQM